MKIALAQFNPTVGDFAGNSARILDLASQAKRRRRPRRLLRTLRLRLSSRSIFSSVPPSSSAISDEVNCLAAKTPLPILVGYAAQHRRPHRQGSLQTPPRSSPKAASFSSSTKCSSPPTTSSTSPATSSPPTARRLRLPLRAARHHRLRRHLERQNFLGQAALRPRSRHRTRRPGRQRPRQYLRLALHHRQALPAPRHASLHGPLVISRPSSTSTRSAATIR